MYILEGDRGPWADSAGRFALGVLLIAACVVSWSWVLR